MSRTEVDATSLLRDTRKRCKDKFLLGIIEVALLSPDLVSARQTSSGIRLVGPNGTASTHFTNSDVRAVLNFRANLRRAGLYPYTRNGQSE